MKKIILQSHQSYHCSLQQCDCLLLNYPFILDWQNNYVKATYTNYLSVSVCVYCYFRIYSTDSRQIVGSFEKQCVISQWGIFSFGFVLIQKIYYAKMSQKKFQSTLFEARVKIQNFRFQKKISPPSKVVISQWGISLFEIFLIQAFLCDLRLF